MPLKRNFARYAPTPTGKSVYLFRSLSEFEAEDVPAGISSIPYGDGTLDLLLVRRDAPNLVVIFHAAADPATATLPIFVGLGITESLHASVLYVSDPAMDFHIPIGWYAGDHERHLQSDLQSVIRHVAASVGATNIIFHGSSAGGFASLVYSHAFPGSLAIAINPQTDIHRYHQSKVEEYLRACWQGLKPTPDQAATNALELYAGSFPNYVLYLQNQRDDFHLTNHYAPWAQRFSDSAGTRWTTITEDWGEGHAPPPPLLQEGLLHHVLSYDGDWGRLIRDSGSN